MKQMISEFLKSKSKAIAGLVAGAIVSWLMKHNIVIADQLPDAIEIIIAAAVTYATVWISPPNRG